MPKKMKKNKKKTKNKASSLVPKIKGKGFYSGFLSDIGGGLGAGLGSLFGNASVGKTIGSGLGSIVSKVTGMGSYRVNSNTLISDTGTPVFATGAEGTVVVSRREFVGDILGSKAFRNNTFRLNPGNPALFPWLSNVAHSFEQYEILGMILEYRPTSGSAVSSTNNAMGVVIMTTNYDVLDPAFTSKQQMEAYQYTISTVPYNHAIHAVECKRELNVLDAMYVRQFVQPQSADPRFYDLGLFQIATVGMQADDINVGELWVSYHVKLLKPRLADSQTMAFWCASDGILASLNADPQPDAVASPSVTELAIPNYTSSANNISVALEQPGNYIYTSNLYTSATTNTSFPFVFSASSSTNCDSVFFVPSSGGMVNPSLIYDNNNASKGVMVDSGSTTIINGREAVGSLVVGRGGGIANFICTNGTAPAISEQGLVIEYQGFEDSTVLAGDSVSLSQLQRNPNSAIEQRLRELEQYLRSSKIVKDTDDEEKEYVPIPPSDKSKRK